jgi:predicted nucleotidyltransferase
MTFDLEAMLRALREVDFILVGGVAAAVQGAPVVTQDVDILYRIEPSNLARLEAALWALDAVARDHPRGLRFGISHLQTKGHELTLTRAGPLDVLGSINEEQLLFEDLLPHSDLMDFDGLEIRVLRLAKLVELKRILGRPKDLAVMPLLEATLREREAGGRA